MTKILRRLLTNEAGASATEYAILLALVAGAVVAAGAIFTTKLSAVFTALGEKLLSIVGT